tara:strand:+ start:209 stop:475 length:267 start_codon:yes stop_codon:yes gene_type:complete
MSRFPDPGQLAAVLFPCDDYECDDEHAALAALTDDNVDCVFSVWEDSKDSMRQRLDAIEATIGTMPEGVIGVAGTLNCSPLDVWRKEG